MACWGMLGVAAALLACLGSTTALDNGLGLTPPLGWSTWCTGGKCGNDFCSDSLVMAGAAALESTGMKALGWDYIVLDDCWAATRNDTTGELMADSRRFPRGMKALAAALHAMGIKLGLYLSAGNRTCNEHGQGHPVPGSEGHFQTDVNTLTSWDIDYVKLDWCGDVHSEIFKGRKYHIEFSEALNHSSPSRPMFFEAVAGYLFLVRESPQYLNSWRDSADHHDVWSSTGFTIEAQADLAIAGRPGGWGYMDILTVGGEGCPSGVAGGHCPGQTDEEYRAEFTIWSLTQSPLFVATDIRNMTAVMSQALLNADILKWHQDTRTPPGKRSHLYPCSELGKCSVYTRPLGDGSFLFAFYNAGTKSHEISIDTRGLMPGWTKETALVVQDLWKPGDNHSQEVVMGGYDATVPSHGAAYVRLYKAPNP